LQLADGVDEETWTHHLRAGHYSRWFRDVIKDDELARETRSVEADTSLPPADARERIKDAIRRRYTGDELAQLRCLDAVLQRVPDRSAQASVQARRSHPANAALRLR